MESYQEIIEHLWFLINIMIIGLNMGIYLMDMVERLMVMVMQHLIFYMDVQVLKDFSLSMA